MHTISSESQDYKLSQAAMSQLLLVSVQPPWTLPQQEISFLPSTLFPFHFHSDDQEVTQTRLHVRK